MQMTDNTVLVTGGGTGIGRGLAESLHRLGNRVVIAGRRSEPLKATASANPGIEYLHLDQSDPADIQRVAAELTDRYPDINVVLNNAGIQLVEDLTGGDVAAAESMVAINLLGPIRLTAALLPTLMAQPRAAILNVTSGLGFVPNHVNPTYSATKAALHSYTQSLRFQLCDTVIQVIEIIPPHVQTGLQGERGYDPKAMPLDAYIAETMSLLQARPQATEMVVRRAQPLRFAERDGTYEQLYAAINPTCSPDHARSALLSQMTYTVGGV
ncbi:MAG: SDR family NAD(P)-dependent oxidoreductase [Mycobacterium sp.]